MPEKKAAAAQGKRGGRPAAAGKRDRLRDLVRLQHHVIAHTSDYFQRLSDLAGQGTVEPREYIEEYFKLWSDCLDEVGDWWKPRRELPDPEGLHPVAKFKYEMRSEKGDFRIDVPLEVFDRYRDAARIHLSTDGLMRTFDRKKPFRPLLTLAPEQNVRVEPRQVSRTRRRSALKIFGVEPIVSPGEIYQGIVWGATTLAGPRFPVSMVELRIV